MKIGDLRKILNDYASRDPDFDKNDIRIPISKPSVAHKATVNVGGIYVGFDWDQGVVFIAPAIDLVPLTEKEHAFDMAIEFLMWLATKPNKNETYEIRQAKAILDNAGIEYMKHQRFLHQDKFGK